MPAHALLLICDFLANTNITVLPQPPYSPDLAPADFLISQTEIHFERMTISDESRDYGKFADGGTRKPKKGIPELFPEVTTVLEALPQCRRGVL
jgi:hypothetical protein